MTKRILIFGIDGATWPVLQPAMAEGYMPFVAGLTEAGSSGVLESVVPAITPAAWSSFQTGMNPGRTGIVDFTHWNRQKRVRTVVSADLLPKTMWEIAGEAGVRVGVLNLPMTYPPRPLNGFMVSGLMTPSLESGFTYPPSLKRELLANVPDYHLFRLESVVEESRKENLEELLKWVSAIVSGRSRAARYLIGGFSPDLFMVHFQVSDVVQHLLWPYLDFDHEGFDISKWRAIMEDFYSVLDDEIRSVGEAFAAAGAGPAAILLISDHGFQRHSRRFNLWNWMLERGYLRLNLGRGGSDEPEGHPPIDWEMSRAFPWGRSNEAFICILGDTAPARLAAAGELRSELESVIDPVSGGKVVKAVHLKEDLYSGDRIQRLPDLIVEPCDSYSITGNYEADRELFRTVVPGEDFHAGRHNPRGIFIAAGEGIPSQRNLRARLIDIAPSVLGYLGLPPPPEMDGERLAALCPAAAETSAGYSERERAAGGGPGREAVTGAGGEGVEDSGREEVYSEEEKRIIEERLRSLGYL